MYFIFKIYACVNLFYDSNNRNLNRMKLKKLVNKSISKSNIC